MYGYECMAMHALLCLYVNMNVFVYEMENEAYLSMIKHAKIPSNCLWERGCFLKLQNTEYASTAERTEISL